MISFQINNPIDYLNYWLFELSAIDIAGAGINDFFPNKYFYWFFELLFNTRGKLNLNIPKHWVYLYSYLLLIDTLAHKILSIHTQ